MGDGQHAVPVHQHFKRRLDLTLGLGVERSGRLVQHQDRRVLQEGAHDRRLPALATGQADAVFAHNPQAMPRITLFWIAWQGLQASQRPQA
jgi:hypothetical protein